MNVLRLNDTVTMLFSNGKSVTKSGVSQAEMEFIRQNIDDEELLMNKYLPEERREDNLKQRIEKSNVLVLRGMSVYMPSVAEISMPLDLVDNILTAEEEGNTHELDKYINFWKLVSLNPDARVRNNLFWFIRKWDVSITELGLLKCYRNVDIKHVNKLNITEVKNVISMYYKCKYFDGINPYTVPYADTNLGEAYKVAVDEDETPVFTDHHSHTFTIKIGTPVRMPREEVDCDQEHSCSSGLHVGSKGWLKKCYFGAVGLEVLVDPSKVCAVPTIDDYGKMRVCEYFPTAIIDFDENGDVIENPYDTYKDLEYLKTLSYEGDVNNEDIDNFIIHNDVTHDDIYASILAKYGVNV